MFPEAVASNDPTVLAIRLREPLTDDIKGTVSWTDTKGKTFYVDLSKITDRQNLVLPVKSDKTSLEGTTVKVYLTNGSFSEKFEVPVKETQNKRP